ncbi:MAG: MAPEG family protein [Gammaproteobacteria bacterium]|nr:MAPEG family protein [Gammaproteobacteria bacterium]MBV9696838.1 MAPEG family protein [Gammaproteobacteria bacterium]
MPLVHLVLVLALAEFFFFLNAVGRARSRFGVKAPATTGHEVFERVFRVQMNTLEQLIIFVPSLLLFAAYVHPAIAAALGAVFILGRALYYRGYVRDPRQREMGFLLSVIPNVALLLGALIGTLLALGRLYA